MAKQKIIMYHNTRCTKSKCALDLLRENDVEPEIIQYMKEVPTREELKKLLMKLNLKAVDIVRKNEPYFKKKLTGLKMNNDEWIRTMVEHPELIERPIIVKGNKAIIGRPAERIFELI